MRIITVTRRPCVENIAKNCVKHGTGAMNIDACRVGVFKSATPSGFNRYNKKLAEAGYRPGEYQKPPPPLPETPGRWPANLIVQHHPRCTQTGTQTLPGYWINRWTDGAKPFGGGAGHAYESQMTPDESCPIYDCDEGCAVRKLGSQSGVTSSGAMTHKVDLYKGNGVTGFLRGNSGPHNQRSDSGTVDRFFQQVGIDMTDKISENLWTYLTTLITSPEKYEPNVLQIEDPSQVDWASHEDQSVHGIVLVGDPTIYLDDLDRVLKPGAHMLLISESNDLNFEAVCNVENYGYEVRDSICYLDSANDGFLYTAKASSSERNAGLKDRCTHPTVKPISIMQSLLQDVQGTVCDPFMGSGTTGIACLNTGHEFLGIEKEGEYVQIAHDRITHWNAENMTKLGAHVAEIHSDVAHDSQDEALDDLNDLFG